MKARPKRPPLGLFAGLLVLAASAVVVATRFEVTTDITHFLPAGTDQRLVHLSQAVARSELTRTVVLTVGGPDAATAARAAEALAERLRGSEQVEWVQRGVDAGLQRAVHELYFPRRLAFLSERPEEELAARLDDPGLARDAAELKRQLASPTSPFIRQIAAEDPLLAFPAQLERLKAAQAGRLELRGGQFVTAEGRGVVILGGRGSAFHSATQRALQGDITEAFEAIHRAEGGSLDLDQSGAGRFAIAAEAAIKGDITRISIFSTVGVILLFLGLFRSPRSLGLVALPLVTGVVGATALGLLIFGRLHGLTLAFGATLIGVCVDYAVHLLSHHALAPHPDGAAATMRRIRPALVIGALTTVAGLAGLAWTSLPGLREIALFASTGVALALLSTELMLPPLLPRGAAREGSLLARLAGALGRLLAAMRRRRSTLVALPLVALGLCVVSLPRLRWRDDLSALQPLDAGLRAEDERVRTQISQMDTGRFVIALGATEEAALRANDEAYLRLSRARDEGVLGDFRSLHPLLWSADLQRRNRETLDGAADLRPRLEEALRREGFRPQLFAPFFEALDRPPPAALRYDDLARSPLADLVRPFRVTAGHEVAFLTFLRDVRDPDELRRRLEGREGLVYFDQLQFLSDTYRHCRSRTLQLMLLGLVAVFLLVLARYRRLGLALAAFAPSLLAAVTALAVITLSGTPATLLHLLGLLLVLSMGVDYGVFMVESRREPEALAATAVALVVACLSTVLAFGLLALSSNPALRALGLTTGLGVLFSLVLAPTALVLLGERR